MDADGENSRMSAVFTGEEAPHPQDTSTGSLAWPERETVEDTPQDQVETTGEVSLHWFSLQSKSLSFFFSLHACMCVYDVCMYVCM